MHDAKGRELKVGDAVMVPFIITQIHLSADYCNVNVESVATMPPENKYKTSLGSLNTTMLLRANPGDDLTFETVHGPLGGTTIR